MKKIIIILLLMGSAAFAQSTVNNYQYVIVPSKFSFSQKKDEARLNTLVKLLFEKYGFKAYLDTDTQPDEIVDSNCSKLFADVESDSGFFTTKVRVILKNCKGKTVFISEQASSKEKDWAKAYNITIREAFKSFDDLHYKYVPAAANTQAVLTGSPSTDGSILTAQPISNGYQLTDSNSNVVMKLFKTSSSERYTAMRGDVAGELTLRNGEWFFEYYQNEKLVSEKVAVKF
jgi:hypothetical protein